MHNLARKSSLICPHVCLSIMSLNCSKSNDNLLNISAHQWGQPEQNNFHTPKVHLIIFIEFSPSVGNIWENFVDFFHVLDHLEHFGGVLFLRKIGGRPANCCASWHPDASHKLTWQKLFELILRCFVLNQYIWFKLCTFRVIFYARKT